MKLSLLVLLLVISIGTIVGCTKLATNHVSDEVPFAVSDKPAPDYNNTSGLLIPGILEEETYFSKDFTQYDVDTHPVVVTNRLNNIVICGHNYGPMGAISQMQVNNIFYYEGAPYKVVSSGEAYVITCDPNTHHGFADTIESPNGYHVTSTPLTMYTCYDDHRWLVCAEPLNPQQSPNTGPSLLPTTRLLTATLPVPN